MRQGKAGQGKAWQGAARLGEAWNLNIKEKKMVIIHFLSREAVLKHLAANWMGDETVTLRKRAAVYQIEVNPEYE